MNVETKCPAGGPSVSTRRFVQGALLSAFSVCISMAALLITSKLFTNALDKETVGVFALLLVTADFIIYVSGLGLFASMPKLVAEADAGQRARIIGSALAGQLVLLLLSGAVIVLLWLLIPHPEHISGDSAWPGVHACLYLLPLLFIIGGLRDLVLAMLAGLNRYGVHALGISVASLSQVILVYLTVWRLGGGLTTLVLAMSASYGIALALLWFGLGAYGRPCCDLRTYKDSVRFSFPLYANVVMNFFNQRFDTVLVTALAGVAQAAVYEMIKRFPVIVNRVMNALLLPYLPHISSLIADRDCEGAGRVLHHAVSISAFAGYGAALFMVALQRVIIVLFFNEEYLSGASVLGLLLVAASFALQSGLMAKTLIALGRNTAVPLVNMTAMVISILANMLLIPCYGIVGAAWVAVFASGISYLLLAVCTHRAGIPVRAWQCVKPILLLLFAVFPLYYDVDSLWVRLASPAVFGLLCLLFGVVTLRQLGRLARAAIPGM